MLSQSSDKMLGAYYGGKSMDNRGAGMKRWNKTQMAWGCSVGLKTNVPVDDWHLPSEKYFHTIEGIEATALPDRAAKIEITVKRVSIAPTTGRKTIVERLSSAMAGRACVEDGGEYSPIFTVSFGMDDGDKFCDTVIDMVSEILKALGAEDDKQYDLANFTLEQKTFIELDGSWISFMNWLRIKHRLPIISQEEPA